VSCVPVKLPGLTTPAGQRHPPRLRAHSAEPGLLFIADFLSADCRMKTLPDAVKFCLGATVYMKLKPEIPGMVTAIVYRPNGITYWVTWSSDMVERSHYDMEITTEKNFAVSES
jgi:hypothetical protein